MCKIRVVLAVGALALAWGCATSGRSAASGSSRDVLTAEELADFQHLDAFEAIRHTRPQWLQSSRGQSSLTGSASSRRGIRVYLDNVPLEGAAELRRLPARNLQEIRFLDAREATLKYGTDHAEGALVIVTRRG